jgi:hypothetical protein
MRTTLSFLAISTTFILNAFAQTQTQNTTVFDPNADNYLFKTTITNGITQKSGEIKDLFTNQTSIATLNGFTIEYKNYYKVVTNLLTQKTYCLVGWNQSLPAGCNDATSFSIPVTEFNIDADSYDAVPFIEVRRSISKLTG